MNPKYNLNFYYFTPVISQLHLPYNCPFTETCLSNFLC